MLRKFKCPKTQIVKRYKAILAGRNATREQRQQAKIQAVLENLNANLQQLRKPSELFGGQKNMQELRQKVDSKKLAKFRYETARKIRRQFSRLSSRAKFSLIHQAFGKNGEKLGLVMVKPEMFAFASQVRKYLTILGFEVLLVKNIIFDRRMLQLVYGKEFHTYPEFPIQAANLISGPSKLMVFRQKATAELLRSAPLIEHLRQTDPEAHKKLVAELYHEIPVTTFDKLLKGAWQKPQPGTIRKEVTYPRLEEIGIQNMSGLASLLDPFGYFKQRIQKGARTVPDVAYYQLTSIHIPSTIEELYNDADAFLTKKELRRLRRKITPTMPFQP
jgi:hypothetical protein